MATLNWSEELELGVAAMDAVHQEFVALLAEVEAASDAQVLPLWRRLVDHTAAHFGAEDRYMRETRFFASNCHTTHHHMVLEVMREGLAMGERGELAPIRQMTRELATWFAQHAETMDTALATHLSRVGYDPATGTIARPELLPAEPIHGCGGSECSPAETATETQAA